MELSPPKVEYTKLINAEWIPPDDSISEVRVFDGHHLIPDPKFREFSPFLATSNFWNDKDQYLQYYEHVQVRQCAVSELWPKIERLILHFGREHWDLFDKQYKELYDGKQPPPPSQRRRAIYDALELYSKFSRPVDESKYRFIKQRIALALRSSEPEVEKLVGYFTAKTKDVDIDHQLQHLRMRWTTLYSAVAPIYVIFYWDDTKHQLSDFTLAQKRFDELKGFYVDCFETFCRISVIAAGIEGIIVTKKAVVPKTKGELSLEQFDNMKNGTKPDILKRLEIADIFIPFVDHKLRNGIGHHSAKYSVNDDKIDYIIESEKGTKKFSIPYIVFCEKVVRLYGQLELVSLYSNWLQLFIHNP